MIGPSGERNAKGLIGTLTLTRSYLTLIFFAIRLERSCHFYLHLPVFTGARQTPHC